MNAKTERAKWNRSNRFYFLDCYGNICLDFADNSMWEHHQLADVGNFYWEREHAIKAQEVKPV